jgi:hypothetical protein
MEKDAWCKPILLAQLVPDNNNTSNQVSSFEAPTDGRCLPCSHLCPCHPLRRVQCGWSACLLARLVAAALLGARRRASRHTGRARSSPKASGACAVGASWKWRRHIQGHGDRRITRVCTLDCGSRPDIDEYMCTVWLYLATGQGGAGPGDVALPPARLIAAGCSITRMMSTSAGPSHSRVVTGTPDCCRYTIDWPFSHTPWSLYHLQSSYWTSESMAH